MPRWRKRSDPCQPGGQAKAFCPSVPMMSSIAPPNDGRRYGFDFVAAAGDQHNLAPASAIAARRDLYLVPHRSLEPAYHPARTMVHEARNQ